MLLSLSQTSNLADLLTVQAERATVALSLVTRGERETLADVTLAKLVIKPHLSNRAQHYRLTRKIETQRFTFPSIRISSFCSSVRLSSGIRGPIASSIIAFRVECLKPIVRRKS
jgi:hypothetical protein